MRHSNSEDGKYKPDRQLNYESSGNWVYSTLRETTTGTRPHHFNHVPDCRDISASGKQHLKFYSQPSQLEFLSCFCVSEAALGLKVASVPGLVNKASQS